MQNLEFLIDKIIAKCHREEGQILAGVQDLDVTFNTTKYSFEEIRRTMMLVCVARDSAAADQAAQNIAVWLIEHEDKRAKLHGQKLLNWLLNARPNPPATLLHNTAINKLSRGTHSDAREANQLLERVLAQQTDPMLRGMALCILAESLRLGRGIAPDQALSILYFCEAADLGNAEAAFSAGVYFEGKSDECIDPYPMDAEKAAHYYEIAVHADVLKAQTNLGILHLFKLIKKHDQAYGRKLLKMAAADGDTAASEAIRSYDELFLGEDQLAVELAEHLGNFEQERELLEAALFADFRTPTLSELLTAPGILQASKADRCHRDEILNAVMTGRRAGEVDNAIFARILLLAETSQGRAEITSSPAPGHRL